MASARVDITDARIIAACNTPGGPVYEWRNKKEDLVLSNAYKLSPVNRRLNAKHRGGVTGTFRASWVSLRTGNQHHLGFNVENFADHAIFVEFGRSESTKRQTFSWIKWHGDIRTVGGAGFEEAAGSATAGTGTSARDGQHVLHNAVNMSSEGDWAPIPLVLGR